MKEQLKAILTSLLGGIRQSLSTPLKAFGLIIAFMILLDVLKGSPDGGTISMLLGYLDAIVKKINLELIALVAVVLSLRK